MANEFELTLANTNTFFTGSFLPNANSVGMTVVLSSPSSATTGSWGGLANTQNALDLSSSSLGTWGTGSWGGLANTQANSLVASESYDRTHVTDEQTPIVNQSMGSGDWNPFPIPPGTVEPDRPQRDLTRYRKSYSSQRSQPKRVRLIKR